MGEEGGLKALISAMPIVNVSLESGLIGKGYVSEVSGISKVTRIIFHSHYRIYKKTSSLISLKKTQGV